MSAHPRSIGLHEVLSLAARNWRRTLLPAAVVLAAAVAWLYFAPASWEASQALVVRNEASGAAAPGKFTQPEEMKTVQETILELARSRGVLEAALAQVGAPTPKEGWPTPYDVAVLRSRVKLVPPKGAQFGTTEIFYLKVRDNDRSRAMALADALCREVESHYKRLRDAKAQSMIAELAKTVELARTGLDASTARLTAMEKEIGSDLPELRALLEGVNGESILRRTFTELCTELRQARTAQNADRELLCLLEAAQADPGKFLATPNRLLDAQPALRQLKQGLVEAQINRARSQGRMGENHPSVKAAREAELEIADHLHAELGLAIKGLNVETKLNGERVAMLDTQLQKLTEQLARLSGVRASYSNLLADAKNHESLVQRAEQNLADARAAQASVNTASLIARLDGPDAGDRPAGPSAATVITIGLVGGVLFGFGLVVLSVPNVPTATAAAAAATEATEAPWSLRSALSLNQTPKPANGRAK